MAKGVKQEVEESTSLKGDLKWKASSLTSTSGIIKKSLSTRVTPFLANLSRETTVACVVQIQDPSLDDTKLSVSSSLIQEVTSFVASWPSSLVRSAFNEALSSECEAGDDV